MVIEYKGIDIFYLDEGQGQPVVLLHGFLGNSGMWKELVPSLKKTNRIIRIDLLGHGNTGNLGYVHTMEMMAEAVLAVVDNLEIEDFKIIGHSMGGYVALVLAELIPNRISGICLMNSTSSEDDSERKTNRDRAIQVVKKNHKAFISMSIANLFRPRNREIFIEEIEDIKSEAFQMSVQGIVAALEGMKIRKDRTKLFREATFEKLMIIGRKDPVLNFEKLRKEAENTNSILVEFSDGHMSHIENKKDLAYKLLRFNEN